GQPHLCSCHRHHSGTTGTAEITRRQAGFARSAGFRFPSRLNGCTLSPMYTTLMLLLLVPADVPRTPAAVVEQTDDLALLSHRQAQRLDGRRVRIRVDLESLPEDTGAAVVYDCVSPDDANRTVWLVPGQPVKDVMEVEGVFRLLWRAPGNGYARYWGYWLGGGGRRGREGRPRWFLSGGGKGGWARPEFF